jgi:serine/threonine protein phosphatase 1
METGFADNTWLSQGGQATVDSYTAIIPEAHTALFRQAVPYHIIENKLFVHAGINPEKPLMNQGIQTFLWDRSFARKARELGTKNEKNKLTEFDEVYIGHTPIEDPRPVQYCEVWMMYTGAGWS